MLWIGVIIGIFLGGCLGIIVIAMCMAAKKGDDQINEVYHEKFSRLHARGVRQ